MVPAAPFTQGQHSMCGCDLFAALQQGLLRAYYETTGLESRGRRVRPRRLRGRQDDEAHRRADV